MVECPSCGQTTNTNEIRNRYFLGRNSQGIAFFKCEWCGNLLCLNEADGTCRRASRGQKGSRLVPITWGLICWLVAGGILWVFGRTVVPCIVAGVFLLLGWSSVKIGVFASRKVIDEMCLDHKVCLSAEAENELRARHRPR